MTRENLITFQGFKKLIASSRHVYLSTHVLPDGDGLGAQVALFHYLKHSRPRNAAFSIWNPDNTPARYRFLDPQGTVVRTWTPKQKLGPADLWIIVDTHDPRRLGPMWDSVAPQARNIVFLDHHPKMLHHVPTTEKNVFILRDIESSSIGEMLYRFFKLSKLSAIDKKIATGLYVSVMTDTNSFRYSRTTPLAHRICGEMIENGVNPEEIYQSIYSSKELKHLQLLGEALRNTKVSADGKIAWIEMGLKQRKHFGASSDDTLSFLNLLFLLKNPEIICLFREEENKLIRVSIRSKGKIKVHRVAEFFGGGGHEYACGAAMKWTMKKTVQQVLQKLSELS